MSDAAREVEVRLLASDSRIGLRCVAGERGLSRPIRHPRVQKNGLALAGHFHGLVPTRVQLFGETELSYLAALSDEARSRALRSYCAHGLSCIVVTKGGPAPFTLEQAAEASGTPLLLSDERTSATINSIHAVLDDELAPTTSLHGVLVDVFGVGILLLGKSGIGKSECALELVLRGHRLVADDMVHCDSRPPNMVFGEPAPMLRHHMEIRGLGILNIKDMFGVTSVRERKRIDIVVRLAEWQEDIEYDRLGVEDHHHVILGTRIRMLNVPVRPGRDMGSILEIAARNELLQRAGTHSARNFVDRLHSEHVPESMMPEPAGRLARFRAPPSSVSAQPGVAATLAAAAPSSTGRNLEGFDAPERNYELEESSAWCARSRSSAAPPHLASLVPPVAAEAAAVAAKRTKGPRE
jgi:HPr kinase/phosphorylase